MRIFVTGATGVMGRSAVRALLGAGHVVAGLARDAARAATLRDLDVQPMVADYFDAASLTRAFTGSDVVCNLATHVPVGFAGMRPGAWRLNDRIRAEGSRLVAEAARSAGVTRLLQESVSFAYADQGDEWITESSSVEVSRATEPIVLAETHAAQFAGPTRDSVVLRFGSIVGDDDGTRWRLARVRSGHPIGLGDPMGWCQLIHSDDIGTAVLAALSAPSGVYNVGAEPVRRGAQVDCFAAAMGAQAGGFVAKSLQRLAGDRLEMLGRSQRVSSELFIQTAAWKPDYPVFDSRWLAPDLVPYR